MPQSPTSSSLPIVLLHGYSDRAESFGRWRQHLIELGYRATAIRVGEYVSLSNEVSIKDIAEAFDRALRLQADLEADEPFDLIVHSTGMLVARTWLATYAPRRGRVKRLIGLAPATFGSPLAHKGRSWLGAIFKGGKEPGPDFMEAGDQVLAALELGSRYTWELAHRDLVGGEPVYGPSSATPYPFIFVGLKDYGWLQRALAKPGTDGTVRWAGAGFNARKISLDLTRRDDDGTRRVAVSRWKNVEVPLVFLRDLNHSTILSRPSRELVEMAGSALRVGSASAYRRWRATYAPVSDANRQAARAREWQQFVVRAVDERGDPIRDYFLELCRADAGGTLRRIEGFDADVHAFQGDPSYRCFHVDLRALQPARRHGLCLRIIASSGTELVGYHGAGSEKVSAGATRRRGEGKWDATIDLSEGLRRAGLEFFVPYTTTLVEIRLNREPMPLVGESRVFRFV